MMNHEVVPVTAFQQNCTILWCTETKKAAVIDPGGDIPRINKVLAKLGVAIEKVWVTHAHIDHAGAVHDFATQHGVSIEGPHRGDQFWIDGLSEQGQMYGFTDAKSFTPTRWLDQGDVVTFGNIELEVLHCPGHTPGHVVFYHRQSHFAIVGDVIFQGSIGRTDFPKSDQSALINAIRNRLWPLGDDVTFLPGHGPTSTIGDERRTNPFVGDSCF